MVFFMFLCTNFDPWSSYLYLGNENKSKFILHFARFTLTL